MRFNYIDLHAHISGQGSTAVEDRMMLHHVFASRQIFSSRILWKNRFARLLTKKKKVL